jgi:hypothetical protein
MSTNNFVIEFKGARDYLHGTDIFNQTLTWLETQHASVKDIDFAFHRLATRQLVAVIGSVPAGAEAVAVCSYTAGERRERVFLVETEQEVMGRYPYPEDEIASKMDIDTEARCGVLHDDVGFSNIEVWVAMTKSLHYKVFSHLSGKWLFVRGRFPQYMRQSGSGERSLTIVSSFNDKLTRSEAMLDGVKVGEIYFSIV